MNNPEPPVDSQPYSVSKRIPKTTAAISLGLENVHFRGLQISGIQCPQHYWSPVQNQQPYECQSHHRGPQPRIPRPVFTISIHGSNTMAPASTAIFAAPLKGTFRPDFHGHSGSPVLVVEPRCPNDLKCNAAKPVSLPPLFKVIGTSEHGKKDSETGQRE